MDPRFYTTGNVICGECGRFMVPELRRLPSGAFTGELPVSGHAGSCSQFGMLNVLRLPSLESETRTQASAAENSAA